MPKELTHWILADRALADLPPSSALGAVIRGNHSLYLAGSVLPDSLLHQLHGPHAATALALAKRFHDPAGNSFAPLIEAEERSPDGLTPPLLACLLGVIAHMQADIVFHPLVHALAPGNGMGAHYRVETDIDCHFLRLGVRPPVKRLTQLLAAAPRDVLLDAAALLFDRDNQLPRAALDQSIRQHCHYQGLYDRTFWKLAVRGAALLPGSPFREQRHLFYPLAGHRGSRFAVGHTVEWRHPVSGELHRTTIDSLADETVRRTVATFQRIEGSGTLAAALTLHPGENLLTGMHGACHSAIKSDVAD